MSKWVKLKSRPLAAVRSLAFRSVTAGSLALVTALATAAAAQAGCGSGDGELASDDKGVTPVVTTPCVSAREQFTNKLWGEVFRDNCVSCHGPGGAGDAKGSKFRLVRETYPDFVSANVNSIREYAKLESSGKALLLRKTIGEAHAGGVIFKEDSEQYKSLERFVSLLKSGTEQVCATQNLEAQSLSLRATYRRAAVLIAGRIPKDEEFAAVTSEDALTAATMKLTESEAFYVRLREIWNDALLTERSISSELARHYGGPCELFDGNLAQCPTYASKEAGELREWTSRAVTEQPMRLIEFIVRNDLPFSDVVAADYVVANPYLAMVYNVAHSKPALPENYGAWQRLDVRPLQKYTVPDGPMTVTGVSYVPPVAGVLSTPSFLTRWESTPTNKGRKRARVVLKHFLATDILKFSLRPVDVAQLTSIQNPTLNNPECAACHKVLDPIAGGFRGYSENTNQLSRFTTTDPWHDDLAAPGFGSESMPATSYKSALSWLGGQILKDPRFPVAVAQTMYRGLIGDEPLSFPTNKDAPDYADQVRAFVAQNDWFVRVAGLFAASKYNLRVLVAELVKSPYFRATSGDGGKDGLHAGLGHGRLLTPEMLAAKYRATLGLHFFSRTAPVQLNPLTKTDNYRTNEIVSDAGWRLILGGIDSQDVITRFHSTSPLMLATNEFMGATMACRAASFEFAKPAASRILFQGVEQTTAPFGARTSVTAPLVAAVENAAKIRETIRGLHFRLLGEELALDAEEVTRTVRLFEDVWKGLESADLSKAEGGAKNLPGYCHATTDFDAAPILNKAGDGVAYPALIERGDVATPYQFGMKLTQDVNYTIRAWQAVLTYLLSDYRFTHE